MYRGKREAPPAVRVRDQPGELFCDEQFADAFERRGRPGWSPGRRALVTVLQKAANLTDPQAADEARENLAWKYALGLRLDDPASTARSCRKSAPAWSGTSWRRGCWTFSWTGCANSAWSKRAVGSAPTPPTSSRPPAS
ncbi:transposase [Streptomyces sp. NBC_01477]|uniref:transposase n=1 Tax=Streptomyces sp. NBC_01477 TaxID=2976015 RepID=UPI002E2F3BF9|nr:transposase [Streptomyces sp. NBC_01477]